MYRRNKSRRFSKIVVLVALLALYVVFFNKPLTNSVFSTETNERHFYESLADLNVRSGPGTTYDVSFALRKGDEVELLSMEDGWYKIEFLGQTGYANSDYLQFTRTLNAVPGRHQRTVNSLLFFLYALLILSVIYFIYKKLNHGKSPHQVFEPARGTPSERELVRELAKVGIPSSHIFHDLLVDKEKDHFAQIDAVAVTRVGIIVFEVKDYSGWIYGSGNDQKWTQVLNFGKEKHRFYNPIAQNKKHVSELKKKLIQFREVPFYSAIVFYGECELKNIEFVPEGTFVLKSRRVNEVVNKIMTEGTTVQYTNEKEVLRVLMESTEKGGIRENQAKHIEQIKDMLGTHRVFD